MTQVKGEESIGFEVLNEVGIIAQLAGNRFERLMPNGLSMAGFSVLNNFVRLGGDRTPAGLASAFQVTRGAMTNTLQRLEAAGLVTVRTDGTDRRVKRVTITDAGRAARDDCIARLGPSLAALAEGVPSAELTAVLPTLRRLRLWLDAHR